MEKKTSNIECRIDCPRFFQVRLRKEAFLRCTRRMKLAGEICCTSDGLSRKNMLRNRFIFDQAEEYAHLLLD